MNPVEQYLAGRLAGRASAGNLRHLPTGRAPVDFYSNDYLGLATHPEILGARQPESGYACNTTGSTGSRLLSGNSSLAEELETKIAAFHGAEAALLFNSGYDANVGLLSAIASRHTVFLYDELCHASIIDGIRLSQCGHKYKFRHNDTADLAHKLKKYQNEGPVIVVTESVFSMDGDMAPLASIAALCAAHDAQLVADEAHATGVAGPNGQGLVCAGGLQHMVFARVHTFGKALGCHGAAVVGGALLKEYLINFARTFIYTTALPGHALQSVSHAYDYLSSPAFTHRPLHQLIGHFRARISEAGMAGWTSSTSPIQALVLGSNHMAKTLALQLRQAGLQVSPILSPTVPAGMERLRVCLHSFNTAEQVDLLVDTCAGWPNDAVAEI